MNRIDFIKTLGVLAAVPLLVAVETTSNHDAAIKKIAEYLNVATSPPDIGTRGILVHSNSTTQMDIDLIERSLKYRHKPINVHSRYNLSTGTKQICDFSIVFFNEIDLKKLLSEVLPYITKFAVRDRIKKHI